MTTTKIVLPEHPLDKMREPFPAHQISKLPKETKKQREEREADRSKGVSCTICGGWHHRNAVHLDYVGHAALTDRLLDVDPAWSWEPVAFRDGLPAFDNTGGLWIKLTVMGVSRLGYGHAAAKPQMDPGAREKEVIGDALRNAAMRFGAALDLWHKGDLHVSGEGETETAPETTNESPAADFAIATMRTCRTGEEFKDFWSKNKDGLKEQLTRDEYQRVVAAMHGEAKRFAGAETETETPFKKAA